MDWKTIGNYALLVGLFATTITMFNQVNGRLDTMQAETNRRFDATQAENARRFDTMQAESSTPAYHAGENDQMRMENGENRPRCQAGEK